MSIRASALRRGNRLNNKTPLRIERGELPGGESVLIEPEEPAEGSKAKLISGVEKDEITEHHLQAALARGSLIHSTPSSGLPTSPSLKTSNSAAAAKAAAGAATQPLTAYHIPTPDAAGINRNYDVLYGTTKWSEPVQYVKFSDQVEQSSYGWGGLGYDMDDEDVLWLKVFNAKEEGTSEGAMVNGSPQGKRMKGKDKEKDGNGPLKISEDEFEYVMGMLELWTDRNVPMLHTNLSIMPQFAAVESIFAQTPSASWYPSYEVPRNVLPPPRHLIRIARNIFPHWKARRERRKGHRIIPQLNFDETNDGDPYVCFRRRDVKVTRKTRQKDMMVFERMKTIQPEMTMATKIVGMVFERERDKDRMIKADRALWDERWNLLQFKRKNPHLPITPEEELLLTPERKIVQVPTALQQQQQQQTNTQAYAAAQARKRLDREREDMARQAGFGATIQNRLPKSRAQSPVSDRVPPEQLAGLLAKRVEEELRRKKEADRGWEDSADIGYHPLGLPASQRHFRHLPFGELPSSRPRYTRLSRLDRASSSESEDEEGLSERPSAFRLRRGRCGVVRLDRRGPYPSSRPHRSSGGKSRPGEGAGKTILTRRPDAAEDRRHGPWQPFKDVFSQLPRSRATSHTLRSDADEDVDRMDVDCEDVTEQDDQESLEERERARILSERWRYDSDMGAVGLGMGVDEEEQVVLDDYEAKYIKLRTLLIKPEDLMMFSASTAALDKVRDALDNPTPQPQTSVVFQHQTPQQPILTIQQQQQQQQAQMMRQQQLDAAQRQQQAQYNLKQAGVPIANGPGTPVNGQHPGGVPQIRRMASNGPVQMGMARPSQSPVPGMQQMAQQQQLPQQLGQVPQMQMQTPQQLAARAALQQQFPNGIPNGTRMSPQMQAAMAQAAARMVNGVPQPLMNGGQVMPGNQPMMPPQVPRGASGSIQLSDGAQPMQVDSPQSSNRTPANSGHLQLPQVPADGSATNGNGMQRSPRQPLSQPTQMPNGVQMDPSLVAALSQVAGTNATPAQQEKLRALLEKRNATLAQQQASGQGLPGAAAAAAAAAMFAGAGQATTDGSAMMNLKLPQNRANQVLAAQAAGLRAGGSPVHSNASPRVQHQQPSMA